jgi:hypothetical protein
MLLSLGSRRRGLLFGNGELKPSSAILCNGEPTPCSCLPVSRHNLSHQQENNFFTIPFFQQSLVAKLLRFLASQLLRSRRSFFGRFLRRDNSGEVFIKSTLRPGSRRHTKAKFDSWILDDWDGAAACLPIPPPNSQRIEAAGHTPRI